MAIQRVIQKHLQKKKILKCIDDNGDLKELLLSTYGISSTDQLAEEFDEEDRMKLALLEIKKIFPSTPGGRLYFAIIQQAMNDLYLDVTMPVNGKKVYKMKIKYNRLDKRSAEIYLSGKIRHAEACGVSTERVHRVLKFYRVKALT